jgi:hypothetical protein
MREGVNFRALCRERGKIVPGTLREGHNVFTTYGEKWLTYLMSWKTIADPDVDPLPAEAAHTDWRLRYMGIGSGTQLENKNVLRLVTPLAMPGIAAGAYWKPIIAMSFPTVSSVMAYTSFTVSLFTPSIPKIISEAGLTVGQSPLMGGTGASIAASVGSVTTVTGLSGLTPIHEEQPFRATTGAHPGNYRVIRVLSPTSLEISSALWGSPETGVTWQFSERSSLVPVVAYKSFEGLVLIAEYTMQIYWQLKF